MSWNQWLLLAIAGLGLVAVLFFTRQLKNVLIVVRNGIAGCIGFAVCNMVLAPTGILVGINLMTAFIVGILGVPGFLLLYLAQWMVK